jgi:aspartyl-tRNA(Asn)/glutamyl-tRNA(Gln) amidotransferase subunit B
MQHAIEFEVRRQVDLVEDGGRVVQETRLFDPDRGETRPMRSKEDAQDYRYFPDPDLPPLVIAPAWIERVRAALPELPEAMRERLVGEHSLSDYEAVALTSSRAYAMYFEDTVRALGGHAKLAASWLLGEVAAALNRTDASIQACPVPPAALAGLLRRIVDGTISGKIAKDVLDAMWAGEGDADAIIERRGLRQISDTGAIGGLVDQVLSANPGIVAEFHAGKAKAFNALVGKVMAASKGKANPGQVNVILRERLGSQAA